MLFLPNPLPKEVTYAMHSLLKVEVNGHSKASPGKSRSKRSPGSSGRKKENNDEIAQALNDLEIGVRKNQILLN
ncbi:hypothetical protein TNIN_472151 [Trichonephila inaurata madagascariensis]|uniref:Uncharacterized protein n=1 Tax=Trichonephila inaurata madagascariensis TaxID=2747483 RepID=A0A8X6XD38_9ARAC|nr:hypothetical protein TNIN_472151 [Trichonephila inaurata madagascariensis]